MGRLQAPLYLTGAYLSFWKSCHLVGQLTKFGNSQVDTYPSAGNNNAGLSGCQLRRLNYLSAASLQ